MLRKLRKITAEDIKCAIMFAIALIPGKILKIFKKNIWLIAERPKIAGDNGLELYRWIRKNHPSNNAYFILDKAAWNFDAADNHMIAWGSLRHYIFYVASDIHVDTMFQSNRMNVRVCSYFDKIFIPKLQVVYIKHGIIKDGLEMHSFRELGARLFICGAKPEYDYFMKFSDYPPENLVYTGLARFDDLLLNKRDDKFILIIPTWRRYLIDRNLSNEENEEVFLKSEYYKRYSSLLGNRKLNAFLEKNGYKARFCIHAEFRRFLHNFESREKNIEIVGPNESIHELLMSTSMLITDYSSVFFDAAYAEKPMFFYQFDYEEFRGKHFSEGYFSYERDAMGPVVYWEDDLVDAIIKSFDGEKFNIEEDYTCRTKRFFAHHDTNNCQRIYDEIKKIQR